MQNKGLVRLFAILFGLVSIYQLSFTYFTWKTENDAKAFATAKVTETTEDYNALREVAERRYLDSIGNEPIAVGITYNDAKDKELNKGLDLKGGINAILQISVRDILEGLASKKKSPAFTQALDATDKRMENSSDDYLDVFFEEFNNIPDSRLASSDIFLNRQLSDDIQADMDNAAVEGVIRPRVTELLKSANDVIRKRIDKFGVTQPNIQQLGESGRILVELPGAKDIERVKDLLTQTAKLEFWFTEDGQDYLQFIFEANEYVKSQQKGDTEVAAENADDTINALLENNDSEPNEEEASTDNPINVVGMGYQGGPIVAIFNASDQENIDGYLKDPKVRALLPADKRYTKLLWGVPDTETNTVELYAIRGTRTNVAPLQGDVITDAAQSFNLQNQPVVTMQMNGVGAKKWLEMTTEASKSRDQIAVVLDNVVYSAPGINSGPIEGGRSEISGSFTVQGAQDLANVLLAGKLPARSEIIQSEVVGPSLGQEAIDSGIMSFLIALGLVIVWMIFYYGRAGLYADIALLVNLLLIFGILAGLGAVLTLPGIAGIVLTIGISVDANVLIFERIREELAAGKAQAIAIKDGFSNALSSIIDANVTTFLTGVILYVFGTGPIQGFATTLMIGIATSLFTAIGITRLFIAGYEKNGKSLDFSTGLTKNWFRNVNMDFLGKRKMAYVISGILVIGSLAALFTKGLDAGIDFTGGNTYTVRFAQDMNASQVSSELTEVFGSAEAKTYGTDNQLKISTNYANSNPGPNVDSEIQEKLYAALAKYMPDTTYEQFVEGADDKQVGILSSLKVGPTIADDILRGSIFAVLGSLLVVFLYILFRFKRWQFSLGAVVAAFHDVIIVLGFFSVFSGLLGINMEIDQAFIAAILTVIGYSLNDTVVVFDRIREFLGIHREWDMYKTINAAISSTISRTLNTSFTTLIVLLAIFIFGADSIRGLILALIIGVIVGTYSSVFIATPLMYQSTKDRNKLGGFDPQDDDTDEDVVV